MLPLIGKCSEMWRNLRLRSPLSLIASVTLATIFLGLLAFFLPNFMTEKSSRPPFRLIEVRAVSDDGQLLPGALVKLGKSREGMTDTFGEWRRFIRIKEGSQLSVKVIKPGKDGYWYGYRRLTVGRDESANKNNRFALGITMRWVAKQLAKDDAEFGDEFIVTDSQDVLNRKAAPLEKEQPQSQPGKIDNRLAIFFDSSGLELADREARQRFNSGEVAVRRDLINKGFRSDNKSPLQLHVAVVHGDKNAQWLEARLLWSVQGKMQESGELMTFAAQADAMSRLVTQFVEREFPARWIGEVTAQGQTVIRIPLQGKSPISLSLGDMVQDISFQRGRVEGAAIRGQTMNVTLGRVDAEFCRGGGACELRKLNPNRERPFVLKSVALDVPEARVYVGGRLARPQGNQAFEYFGQQGRSYPVAVVRKYAVVGRGSVTAQATAKPMTSSHQARTGTRKR